MSPADDLGFRHRYLPGAPGAGGVTLLLLHGTGGDESDLIPIGQSLAPGAALLSPRGRVLENGMPRFFRRLAEGVFDLQDLQVQTAAIAQFIAAASQKYSLQLNRMVAVGYSNGANIASSVLLSNPGLLTAAVLFRPMVPYVPQSRPNLRGLDILIAAGNRDPIASLGETKRLAGIFEAGGATVSMHWHQGGHELGKDDLDAAAGWISQWRAAR